MRFAPRTILGQLITGSLLVQAVVFCTFLFVSVRRELRETRQRDYQRLRRQAGILTGVLGEPLSTANADMLDHVVHAIPVSTSILGVRITDPSGSTLRVSSAALPADLTERERSLLPGLTEHTGFHLVQNEHGSDEGVQAVVMDGRVRGIVWILPDVGVSHRYARNAFEDVALYSAFALLGNLLLVWLFSATMAKPLRQLRLATLQIRNDPSNLSGFPLPANDPTEVGELQASFNAMVNEIALQRKGTHETLNLLDALLESAPIGFAFYDQQFRYVRLNQTLADMNGRPIPAHLGKRYRDLLPPGSSTELADRMEGSLQQVFDTGMFIAEHELSGTAPGEKGICAWLASNFPVVVDGEVRWVGVIVTDITERKRSEEAMRRSERLAAAGRLAASIAHEINNPLESVANLLYLLRTNHSLDTTGQEYVALAQQELSRVGEITQQTLKFYRRSSQPVDIRVPDVLRAVLILHQPRMQSPPVDVLQRLSDKAIIFGYPGDLRQVFANLVGNALDAMPNGGKLYIRTREMRRHGKRGMRVTVADTGVGMPDAVRRRIFEPFFTTKEATGTGLGLWMSAEILAKHRAVILVRSRQPMFEGDRS
ncbi:MAG: sensor histidine kinase, partial [Janthinobacterium lividum]